MDKLWIPVFILVYTFRDKIYWLFKKRFYLFIFRQREGEREGEKHPCVVASHVPPTGGTWPTTQACALMGIELTTLWFSGWCSIH